MTRTITISEDVFKFLKEMKPKNLSYNQFLKILLEKEYKRKKLLEFIEKGPFIEIELEKEIRELRKLELLTFDRCIRGTVPLHLTIPLESWKYL